MSTALQPVASGLRASTSLLGDPRALRQRLADDGYLFLPGLLDPAVPRAVLAAIVDLLDRRGWLAAGTDPSERRAGPAATREFAPGYAEMYAELQSVQLFHELAHQPSLVHLAREVLGADVLVHPRKIARVAIPDDPDFVTGPHQDYRFIQGTADTLTAWIPLHECGVGGGGLKVLRGGHRVGLLSATAASNPGGLVVDVDADGEWLSAEYQPGDVLVFHSMTVHSAQANQSGALRVSCDFRYQSIGDPVEEQSLHPHGHPGVLPDWDALTDGWTSTASIDVPAGLTVVEGTGDYLAELAPPQSRLLGTTS